MFNFKYDPNNKDINNFEKFASTHWGQHSHPGDTTNDFFDRPRLIVEYRDSQNVIAGLVVFYKTIIVNRSLIHIAGIGGVVTHVNYRRKGYGTKLLVNTLKELKSQNLDAILLCTDIKKLGSFYDSVGFKPLNKDYYFFDKNGIKKTEHGGMYISFNMKATKIFQSKKTIFNVGLSNFWYLSK